MGKKKWKIVYTDTFKKSCARLFDWKYAPLRFWHKITYTPKTLRHYWERITKGYSYQDVWSLDYSLANIIVNGMKDLKKFGGVPTNLYPKGYFKEERGDKKISNKQFEKMRARAEKRWGEVLDDIVDGYQAWLNDDWMTKPKTRIKLKKAQRLFNQYWGGFWY